MDKQDKQRLREIRQEMMDLLGEANDLLRQNASNGIYARAKSTWIGYVDTGLGGGQYIDTYDSTFEKTLKELGIDPALEVDLKDDDEETEDEEENVEDDLDDMPCTD